MVHIRASVLQGLAVRATDEVWEVAAAPLLAFAPPADDAGPSQIAVCVCVSSRGGAAMADLQTVTSFSDDSGLQALGRFATEPLTPGARPLGYLPATVFIGPMPDEAQGVLRRTLEELGVAVEIKQEPILSREFFDGLAAHLAGSAPDLVIPGRPIKGLLSVKGMTIQRIAAFAEAGAAFWKARPWTLSDEEILWQISPQPQARALRFVTVMGSLGETFGLGFLSGRAPFRAMGDAADVRGAIASAGSTLWSVTYDDERDFPEQELEVWRSHGLKVADKRAYPFAAGMTMGGSILRPSPANLTLMEGLLLALATLTRAEIRNRSLTREVTTFDGPRKLTLTGVIAA